MNIIAENITFKWADTKDAIEIVHLVNSAYRGDSSKIGWTTEADLLGGQRVDFDNIVEAIEKPGVSILLAVNSLNHEIQGCVQLEQQADHVYLGMLTIQPVGQKTGLGKNLLEAAENRTRDWGFTEIKLTVIAQRTELIEWYERRGYQKTDVRKSFPYGNPRFGLPKRDDLYFIEMSKKIPRV